MLSKLKGNQGITAKITILLALLATACGQKTDFKGSSRQELPTQQKAFQQLTYPEVTSTYTQGHTGEAQDESFEQGEWGPLDVLVVIDNSGSMEEEQVNLGAKLEPLLSQVDKSDWQIGVVTTDPSEGCLQALIKKGDAGAETRFQNAIRAGTSGTGIEQGLYQAVEGLKCSDSFFGFGDSWVREDSTLAVLIVSDEDNCHIDNDGGYGCEGADHRYASYLTDYLASIRDVGKDARVYGLFWHPTDDACSDALKAGDEYAKVVDATGGVWGSICDADYTETLQQISEDVRQILKYEFELAQTPDEGTLEILVDGESWDKFTLNDRKVVFTEPPPFGSEVKVGYRHGAAGDLLTDFDLEKIAVAEGLQVNIDGDLVDADTFTFDAEENQLEFASAPKERSEITISYLEKIDLLTEFEIGAKANPSTIAVTVGGERVGGWSYDSGRGMIVFAEAPAAGAEITVTYKKK